MPDAQLLVEALAEVFDRSIGGAEVFATHTFDDAKLRRLPGSLGYSSIGHAGSVRALTGWLVGVAEVYPDVAAAYAMEPHAFRSSPHFHGLLAGLGDGVGRAIDQGRRGPARVGALGGASIGERQARDRLWGAWFEQHGMARLEAVHGNGASLYVSKYSLKGGDAIPWWQVWEPGELRNAWVASTRRRRSSR